jgi:hypothetical protein
MPRRGGGGGGAVVIMTREIELSNSILSTEGLIYGLFSAFILSWPEKVHKYNTFVSHLLFSLFINEFHRSL